MRLTGYRRERSGSSANLARVGQANCGDGRYIDLMAFHVSLAGRKNLAGEIYRQLRQAILDRRLRPGDLLPPSRELARSLSVSRTTVTVAYDRLAGEGFVRARVGSGTRVSAQVGATAANRRRSRPDGSLTPRALWRGIPLSRAFAKPAAFDFRTGIPDPSLFPFDAWRRLVSRQLGPEALAAGVYAHPAGHAPLREAIAGHLAVSRGVNASPDDVTITNGTQQALDIIARTLVSPGDRVAVEDPGYPPPRRLFESLGARVTGVPLDREGLVVDALPRRSRLVYVTPSHQYPMGMSMSLSRRLALLAWADRQDAAIVEDDYDSEFRFRERPIEALQSLDAGGRVIYVGTFSKTMLPTLRLGFVVAPPSLRDALHRAKCLTDWHTPLAFQAALAAFIEEGGFGRHVRKLSSVYRVRHEVIVETLGRAFADHLEVVPSVAGLHVCAVARGSAARRIGAVLRDAAALGVGAQDLSRFAIGPEGPAGIMLGYGAVPTARIGEGLDRLRSAFG